MTLENVLLVSAVLFAIGLYGVLSRRSAVTVLMSLELMFNAVVVAAVAFSRFTAPASLGGATGAVTASAVRLALTGHVFAVFIIAVAAAEVALGLALVITLFKHRETVDITEANLMKN